MHQVCVWQGFAVCDPSRVPLFANVQPDWLIAGLLQEANNIKLSSKIWGVQKVN